MTHSGKQTKKRRLHKQELADAVEAKREFSRGHFGNPDRPTAAHVHGYASRLRDALARAPAHVHAVGVGRKLVGGKPTNTPCIRLYVTQKLPKHLLPAAALIPPEFAGIPTDIIEAPPAYFAPGPPPPCSMRKTRRQRPVPLGVSGANASVVAGTLGARCHSRRAGEAGLELLLSNNHILADFGAAAPGSAILQPAAGDGGVAGDRIASLLRAVPVNEGSTAGNRVDAAVAALDPGIVLTSICAVGAVVGSTPPEADMQVHKHGRTTGYTIGVIDDPSCDFTVPFSRDHPERVAQFVDQIRIKAGTETGRFAQAGDSGSLVLTKAGNLAVGLIFACPDDSSFAYANPVDAVLDALEVDLV